MGEMLENRTFVRKQMLDNWFAVALIAAPKDMMMGSAHIADAIQLHKPKLLDNFEDVGVAGRSLCKALQIKPKSAGLSIGNSNSHARSEQRSIGKSIAKPETQPRVAGQ